MVAECHQGGEEFEDDRGVDEVYILPHRVRNPVGARCRGGRGLGKGEFDFQSRERGG